MMRSNTSEPWPNTLARWAKVVLAIDLVLLAISLLIVTLRGTWSVASIGETVWGVAFAVGLGYLVVGVIA